MLTTTDSVAPKAATYPNGTHLIEVEIDPETGQVAIENYVVVDDFGVTLNPLLLAGQVHGGAVQGIGQALMERTVYDHDSGQLLTASLLDYALPRAADTPSFRFETRNVPFDRQCAWREGGGRSGRHRLVPRPDQRHRGCAVAGVPHSPHRHAGHPRAGVGGDPGGQADAYTLAPVRAGVAAAAFTGS